MISLSMRHASVQMKLHRIVDARKPELQPGDAVDIPAGVEHWHGAAPDSDFSHIAVMPKRSENKTVWGGPVTEAEYAAAVEKQ